jgi:hypothetical protein
MSLPRVALPRTDTADSIPQPMNGIYRAADECFAPLSDLDRADVVTDCRHRATLRAAGAPDPANVAAKMETTPAYHGRQLRPLAAVEWGEPR